MPEELIETLSLFCAAVLAASMLVGFITGFLCGFFACLGTSAYDRFVAWRLKRRMRSKRGPDLGA